MERLDRKQLMARAADSTGLDDFGDVPFEEALDVLIHSLERDAKLDDERRAGAAAMITKQLTKNLRLVADRKTYFGIADEVIEAPIFILGLPRTGSTNLHGLLAQCEGIRAPRRWEMFQPSPPPQTATYETDPRIAEAYAAEVLTASDELKTRHPMTADRPEQCQGLNDYAFMNWSLLAPYELPSYKEWLLTADHRPSYEAHKRTLQHLQFRHPGRWVLKFPKHAFALDALIAVYPDAKIIWTHRDPTRIIPSAISLIETFRKATPGFDRKILGREWASYEELGIRRGLAMRDNLFAPENVFDMHYTDVIKDPAGSIERAYAYFGMTLSETSKARILSYLADNGKDKHGVHSYTAEEFGLSERMLRILFKDYIERFNVA